jgi:hypothetical protein
MDDKKAKLMNDVGLKFLIYLNEKHNLSLQDSLALVSEMLSKINEKLIEHVGASTVIKLNRELLKMKEVRWLEFDAKIKREAE